MEGVVAARSADGKPIVVDVKLPAVADDQTIAVSAGAGADGGPAIVVVFRDVGDHAAVDDQRIAGRGIITNQQGP